MQLLGLKARIDELLRLPCLQHDQHGCRVVAPLASRARFSGSSTGLSLERYTRECDTCALALSFYATGRCKWTV